MTNDTPDNTENNNQTADNAPKDTNPSPAENTTSDNSKPAETPSADQPGGDSTKVPSTNTETDPPVDNNPADDSKPAEDAQTSQASTNNLVKLTVDGLVKGSREFPKGTTVGKALQEFTDSPNDLALRDKSNHAVSLDRALNDNLEITATKKAARG